MGRFPNVIYCGGIPRDIREKDIEDAFAKFGKVGAVMMKNGYCYVEMAEARDAQDAIRRLQDWREWDRTPLEGERSITVEEPRSYKGFGPTSSNYIGRGRSPPRGGKGGGDTCFKCGGTGHWYVFFAACVAASWISSTPVAFTQQTAGGDCGGVGGGDGC
jgi:RNA recognition motif-containing protein